MKIDRKLKKYGFSLSSVCWGYRESFKEIIKELFYQDLLGSKNKEVTETFFSFMQCADEQFFDNVLKEFLEALSSDQRWILEIPGIFEQIVDIGGKFASEKVYYGIEYFRKLKEGGFGSSPEEMSNLFARLNYLMSINIRLAFSFLAGYRALLDRLKQREIDRYLQYGLEIYSRNPESAYQFFRGTLKTSEIYIRHITKESRLEDIKPRLSRICKALSGREMEVDNLSSLDSDMLLMRGSSFICTYRSFYLPLAQRSFDSKKDNEGYYLLVSIIASAMIYWKSFSVIHGHPDYSTSSVLTHQSKERLNLFIIMEYIRILRRILTSWPGTRPILEKMIDFEFSRKAPHSDPDRLFADCLTGSALINGNGTATVPVPATVRALIARADESVNFFSSLESIDPEILSLQAEEYPHLRSEDLRIFFFLPDFLFPLHIQRVGMEKQIIDLKRESKKKRGKLEEEIDEESAELSLEEEVQEEGEEREEAESAAAAYLYDEWCQAENTYYEDYCHVHELYPEDRPWGYSPEELDMEVRAVRRLFELIKPELAHKEKYLREGDEINTDALTRYLINRRTEAEPRIDFYERSIINKRDLAVLLLLDVSGSTGEEVKGKRIIEIEKTASLILGEGLHSLGDRFSICGFSGSGRENCQFFVFKDFDQDWNRGAIDRVMAGRPMNSTRIGPALRHAGYRLSEVEAQQNLLFLITDGRPMDRGYDTESRYAQFDVRMACQENKKKNIHTFCISTNENSRADMEIMFPDRKFIILDEIHKLPTILPRLYIKMTA